MIKALIKKSQENEDAVKLLANDGKYNAAINRAYYSIYQLIMAYNEKNKKVIKKSENIKGRSHEQTIDKFIIVIGKNSSEEERARSKKLKNDILSLKRNRIIADYGENSYEKSDFEDIEMKYNSVREQMMKFPALKNFIEKYNEKNASIN